MSEEKGLAVIDAEYRIVAPAVSVEKALAAWQAYQDIADKLLDKEDYQSFRSEDGTTHKFRKKSGWRKLATFYGISVQMVDERLFHDHDPKKCLRVTNPDLFKVVEDCGCTLKGARYVVKAVHDQSGRTMEAIGICVKGERRVSQSSGWHDLAGRAYTRAVNRAIADLIGVSDPSAEELQGTRNVWAFSEEERKHLATVFKASHPEVQQAAVAKMRELGFAAQADRDVYIAFLKGGDEDGMAEILAILTPAPMFDPEDVPVE